MGDGARQKASLSEIELCFDMLLAAVLPTLVCLAKCAQKKQQDFSFSLRHLVVRMERYSGSVHTAWSPANIGRAAFGSGRSHGHKGAWEESESAKSADLEPDCGLRLCISLAA